MRDDSPLVLFSGGLDSALAFPFGVRVEAPLIRVSKADIIAELDNPSAAWSCHTPVGDWPCGRCHSCTQAQP